MHQRDDFFLEVCQYVGSQLLIKAKPLHLLKQSLLQQMIVNIERSQRHLGAQVGALLGLWFAIFIIVLLKLPQMRRQIRQQRVVLEALVQVAHPLIKYVERFLLL